MIGVVGFCLSDGVCRRVRGRRLRGRRVRSRRVLIFISSSSDLHLCFIFVSDGPSFHLRFRCQLQGSGLLLCCRVVLVGGCVVGPGIVVSDQASVVSDRCRREVKNLRGGLLHARG